MKFRSVHVVCIIVSIPFVFVSSSVDFLQNNTPIKIRRLFLLQSHMPEFCVDAVKIDFNVNKLKENCQFWECSNDLKIISMQASVSFVSACYGHFEQQVIFEFQNGDKIVRNIGVEVLPEAKLMETLKFKPEKLVESEMTWIEKYRITQFDGEPEICMSFYGIFKFF